MVLPAAPGDLGCHLPTPTPSPTQACQGLPAGLLAGRPHKVPQEMAIQLPRVGWLARQAGGDAGRLYGYPAILAGEGPTALPPGLSQAFTPPRVSC